MCPLNWGNSKAYREWIETLPIRTLTSQKDLRETEDLLLGCFNKGNTYSGLKIGAAQALGQIKDSQTIDPLVAVLKDKNVLSKVKISVAEAISEIKDSRAVPALSFSLLNDEDAEVRYSAAKALCKINDNRAIWALIGALTDKNESVRSKSREALEQITGQQFGDDPTEWRKWWKTSRQK